MLTRSSQRIFNPMRCTGYFNKYVSCMFVSCNKQESLRNNFLQTGIEARVRFPFTEVEQESIIKTSLNIICKKQYLYIICKNSIYILFLKIVFIYYFCIITSERSERSSYQQSYMGRPVNIQSALKPLKKIGKM